MKITRSQLKQLIKEELFMGSLGGSNKGYLKPRLYRALIESAWTSLIDKMNVDSTHGRPDSEIVTDAVDAVEAWNKAVGVLELSSEYSGEWLVGTENLPKLADVRKKFDTAIQSWDGWDRGGSVEIGNKVKEAFNL